MLLALVCLLCGAHVTAQNKWTLTILHDNDLHGHLLPFAYTETGKSPVEQASVGGAARRATLVRSIRRHLLNPSILLDTGDIATRGPLCTTYEGTADVAAMNAVGYELAALGNNEFKLKDGVEASDSKGAQKALTEVIRTSHFPWICANVTDAAGNPPFGVKPFVIRSWQGVRVGFLGLTTARSQTYMQTRGLNFIDPVEAAAQWVPKVRAQCDILIGVTHEGDDADRVLISKVAGFDVVVGGDSHTYLYKAVECTDPSGVVVPIVQDGEFGVNLGRLDLHFVRNTTRWHLRKYEYRLLPVALPLKAAPDVAAALAPFVKPLMAQVGQVTELGTTPAARTRNTLACVASAMRKQTESDVALCTPGILYCAFHANRISRYDVLAALPFRDNVVTVNATGAQLNSWRSAHPDAVISWKRLAYSTLKTRALSDPKAVMGEERPASDKDHIYRVALMDYEAVNIFGMKPDKGGPDARDSVLAWLRLPASNR